MAITTKDLARICGVSRTTVTRALYGQGRISEETKARILKVAEELDYHPDYLARSLVKGKTMTIGVVLCDLKNTFFSYIINEMEPVARMNGYVLNITLHDNNYQLEHEIIQQLVGYKVAGLIISPCVCNEQEYEFIRSLNIPTVILGGMPLGDLPFVGNDEFQAAYAATRWMLQNDYHCAGFVFPELRDPQKEFAGHRNRFNGFETAAKEQNIPYQVFGDEDYAGKVLQYIKEQKELGRKPCFLCSGDVYAAKIMLAAYQENYVAGTDYGVMGFDNDDLMQILPVRLSSVENHKELIGRYAMEELLGMIEDPSEGKTRIVPYEIVPGKSV